MAEKESRNKRPDFRVKLKNLMLNVILKYSKIKSSAYSPQGSHTGQLDFCN
jgi:hypothetical protein